MTDKTEGADKMSVSREVGKEVLFENDRVRIWDMTLEPSEACPLHVHEHDYLIVYVTPSIVSVEVEGSQPVAGQYDDGFVQYIDVGRRGMTPHRIQNVSGEVHRQIIVELLGDSRTEQPAAESNNRSNMDLTALLQTRPVRKPK